MAAYVTQYQSAYRSPHESPTNGTLSKEVLLKQENVKLREEVSRLSAALEDIKQQLSVISKTLYSETRPTPLDMGLIMGGSRFAFSSSD